MTHKYAQIELERRWLLAKLPDSLQNSQDYQLIEDRYITGTPLRLRRMTDAGGQVIARKLTQKYQADDQTAYATTITNFYLDEASYKLLETLPARLLVKKRYKLADGRFQFSIDHFSGPLTGLILAEIEPPDLHRRRQVPHPRLARREGCGDSCWTGGPQMQLDKKQGQQLLQDIN